MIRAAHPFDGSPRASVYTRLVVKKHLILATMLGLILGGLAFQALSDEPWGDSELVFARVEFTMPVEVYLFRDGFNNEHQPPWEHDRPFSEHFYLGILKEVTSLTTSDEAEEVVRLDSDDIFDFPFLYVSEPGYMQLTTEEVDHLREYLLRGGFIMFDDFRGRDFNVLQTYLKRAFPDREMFRLDVTHPMFGVFYTMDSLDFAPPYIRGDESGPPDFWGMNDDSGRLMLVANNNNDIGEFWESLDRAYDPLQPAVDAVRLGVNYMLYTMTH